MSHPTRSTPAVGSGVSPWLQRVLRTPNAPFPQAAGGKCEKEQEAELEPAPSRGRGWHPAGAPSRAGGAGMRWDALGSHPAGDGEQLPPHRPALPQRCPRLLRASSAHPALPSCGMPGQAPTGCDSDSRCLVWGSAPRLQGWSLPTEPLRQI